MSTYASILLSSMDSPPMEPTPMESPPMGSGIFPKTIWTRILNFVPSTTPEKRTVLTPAYECHKCAALTCRDPNVLPICLYTHRLEGRYVFPLQLLWIDRFTRKEALNLLERIPLEFHSITHPRQAVMRLATMPETSKSRLRHLILQGPNIDTRRDPDAEQNALMAFFDTLLSNFTLETLTITGRARWWDEVRQHMCYPPHGNPQHSRPDLEIPHRLVEAVRQRMITEVRFQTCDMIRPGEVSRHDVLVHLMFYQWLGEVEVVWIKYSKSRVDKQHDGVAVVRPLERNVLFEAMGFDLEGEWETDDGSDTKTVTNWMVR